MLDPTLWHGHEPGAIFLRAYSQEDRDATVWKICENIGRCGFLVDSHPFSGAMMAFEIELMAGKGIELATMLHECGANLDEESLARLAALSAAGIAPEMVFLNVTFAHGDPNRRTELPIGPG